MIPSYKVNGSANSPFRPYGFSIKTQKNQDEKLMNSILNQVVKRYGPAASVNKLKRRQTITRKDDFSILLPQIKPAPTYNHKKNKDMIFQALKKTRY